MNKLPLAKRVQILAMLCEGSSMRTISRVVDVSINTVSKLLVDAGVACAAFHDANVKNVNDKRVQCNEIWSFTYAKAKNVPTAKAAPDGAGDTWTWTALGAQSKMIVSWHVGGRDAYAANLLMRDVAERLVSRVQLTTDGHKAYLDAVERAFGDSIDYAMLVKHYGPAPEGPQRCYSPAECVGATKEAIVGNPDQRHISTSYVERQNLTMRMQMRRFTRLTDAFSKKFENHAHMVALYAVWYNFVRTHKAHKLSPAMAAGVAHKLWSMEDLAAMIDAAQPQPGPRGPYKGKRADAQISN
jgi:IS1 family transposase